MAPAQQVDQSITVNKAAPGSAIYNSVFTVSASASSGLSVVYSSGSPSVCTHNGSTFIMVSGSGTCKVLFTQPGDGTYNAASSVEEDVDAQKADQQISISSHAPSGAAYNSNFSVSASSSSGLPVSYSSGSSSICSNSGSMFKMISSSGTCQVVYSQGGNGNYNAAVQLSDSVNAGMADQTISITSHAPSSAAYNTYFTVGANASSGLAVSYSSGTPAVCSNSGATFHIISNSGSCQVLYTQDGNQNYNAASQKSESVSAAQASQTITVTTHAPSSAQVNSSFSVAAKASSGLAVSYSSGDTSVCTNSGSTFTIRSSPGVCPVLFNQGGNGNYSAASQIEEDVNTVEVITITPTTSNVPILPTSPHSTQPPATETTFTLTTTPLVKILTSTPHSDRTIIHIVAYGETIQQIAASYGVTVQEIMTLNNLTSTTLKVGQVLVIVPGNTVTATATNATPSASPTAATQTPTITATQTISPTYRPYATATSKAPSIVQNIFTKRNLIILGVVVVVGLLLLAFILIV